LPQKLVAVKRSSLIVFDVRDEDGKFYGAATWKKVFSDLPLKLEKNSLRSEAVK
jgi:hypothetical protein